MLNIFIITTCHEFIFFFTMKKTCSKKFNLYRYFSTFTTISFSRITNFDNKIQWFPIVNHMLVCSWWNGKYCWIVLALSHATNSFFFFTMKKTCSKKIKFLQIFFYVSYNFFLTNFDNKIQWFPIINRMLVCSWWIGKYYWTVLASSHATNSFFLPWKKLVLKNLIFTDIFLCLLQFFYTYLTTVPTL